MTDTRLPPLHNIRVLDLSRVIAGSLYTMMSLDGGPDVAPLRTSKMIAQKAL